MLIAVTRDVSDSIHACELTHVSREAIDIVVARAQHRAYERALEAAGCSIVRVEPAHDLPDAVFVEDTAVVVPEVAVVTRPGAPSRRPETRSVADVLARYRELRRLEAPATLDGGDVLCVGRRVIVGRTTRTNDAAIEQIEQILGPFGYEVNGVRVHGCLHLKSAVTALSDTTLLVNPEWIAADQLSGFELVAIDRREPSAANILRVGDAYIYPSAFARTHELLERSGVHPALVDVSELAKAEGAVTCCSLIVDVP